LLPDIEGESSIISMDLTRVITSEKISKRFLYYYMQLTQFRRLVRARASGSTVLHLDLNSMKKIVIVIPPTKAEQYKITAALEVFDREMELLQRKTIVLHQQKRALMQRLLTGEVRV
jgi:type I restriction enzyme, S subunit